MAERVKEKKYYRVTDVIGPKTDPTEVILEAEVTIRDYLELENIAAEQNKSIDDVLRNALHEYVRQQRTTARYAPKIAGELSVRRGFPMTRASNRHT